MKIEAAFRQKGCCGQRFRTRSGGSENSHASSRTSNACGSSDRCAIDSSLLLTPHVSGSAGAGRSERPVAVIASLVARRCSHPARHRFHPVVRSAQSMPKAKPVERRPVLGSCFNRPSCDPLPAGHSKPACRVRHANAKSQIRVLAGRDRCCAPDRLVSLAVEGNAARSTPARIPNAGQLREL
jgi:hypothetical protein